MKRPLNNKQKQALKKVKEGLVLAYPHKQKEGVVVYGKDGKGELYLTMIIRALLKNGYVTHEDLNDNKPQLVKLTSAGEREHEH